MNTDEQRDDMVFIIDAINQRNYLKVSDRMRALAAQRDRLAEAVASIARLMRSESAGARAMVKRYHGELDEYASAIEDRADALDGYAEMIEALAAVKGGSDD